jgi:peptide/nickel transport system substrate-binding protein
MTPRVDATRLAIVALAIAIAACTPRDRRTPDDTIVVLIESPVGTLDPRYTTSNYETKFSRMVVPGLVALDTPDMAPRLELAEKMELVSELIWEVTLRADARFSDGTPVTGADVAFSYETMIVAGSDSVYAKQFRERFSRIEVLDERRVRFHLVAPLATFMTDVDMGIVAAHAAGPSGKFPGGRVIGAGPYKLGSLTSDRLVLERNPHYHGVIPKLPRVDVRVVRDASARIVMLVGGSADLAQNVVRLDLVDDVAERERITIETGPSSILTYMMFNNEDPVLKDVRVRQAIALAIDREAIIDAKFSGRAVLATGLLPPGHWAYEGDVARWTFDRERAKRLLDEAGYPDPDGDGPAPRLRMVYKTSADQFRVALARVLASQLGDVGIDVEVRAFEFATFFADIKKGAYQIATMQTSDIGEPDYYLAYFHSSRIPTAAAPNYNNRWRYRNPKVDELTDRGRRVVDLAERKRIYGEVQQIIANDVPIIALWHEDNVVLTHRDVVGYQILPNARFNGLVTVEKR